MEGFWYRVSRPSSTLQQGCRGHLFVIKQLSTMIASLSVDAHKVPLWIEQPF